MDRFTRSVVAWQLTQWGWWLGRLILMMRALLGSCLRLDQPGGITSPARVRQGLLRAMIRNRCCILPTLAINRFNGCDVKPFLVAWWMVNHPHDNILRYFAVAWINNPNGDPGSEGAVGGWWVGHVGPLVRRYVLTSFNLPGGGDSSVVVEAGGLRLASE